MDEVTDQQDIAHYSAALKVAKSLQKHGFDAYIIGGAVRDILLGELPKDFDIVTNATPDQVAAIPDFERSKYKDTAQAYGVSRVLVGVRVSGQQYQSEVEVATYRRDIEAHLGRKATKIEFSTLEDDINRRDLTINALALDPATGFLVDYVDGLLDLEAKLIRFIGAPAERISEDPLRLLRAIRLRNQLAFSYEPAAKKAIERAAKVGMVEQIAIERLQAELNRMFVLPSRHLAIEDLDDLAILKRILPEVTAGKGISQPPQFHSEGDVWTHTLLTLQYLPKRTSKRLVWAALLHDIGKPPTWSMRDRIRFDDHFSVGANMAQSILKRLRFSRKLTEEVVWMIENHLNIDNLPKMRPAKQLAMLGHPAFADLLELHKADAHAAWGKRPNGSIDTSQADFSELEQLWQDFQERAKHPLPTLKQDLGVDGNWLKENFKLESGQQLGQLLQNLNEAYLNNEVTSKQAAKQYVKGWLKESKL